MNKKNIYLSFFQPILSAQCMIDRIFSDFQSYIKTLASFGKFNRKYKEMCHNYRERNIQTYINQVGKVRLYLK